jgi:hypothetical protein
VPGGARLPGRVALRLTRRGLLRSVILAFGLDPASVLGPLRRWVQDVRPGRPGEAGAASSAANLSSSELDDLIAFAELLVEGRPLSPTERGHLVQNIEERVARERDYLVLYRTTVRLLERLAGRRFSSLDLPQRVQLITRHRLDSTDVRPGDDLRPFPNDTRAVRTRAVRDLIADYYGSPAGWAVVGYEAYPGKCGDLSRYTQPES